MNFDNLVGWGGWVKGSKIFKIFFFKCQKLCNSFKKRKKLRWGDCLGGELGGSKNKKKLHERPSSLVGCGWVGWLGVQIYF